MPRRPLPVTVAAILLVLLSLFDFPWPWLLLFPAGFRSYRPTFARKVGRASENMIWRRTDFREEPFSVTRRIGPGLRVRCRARVRSTRLVLVSFSNIGLSDPTA